MTNTPEFYMIRPMQNTLAQTCTARGYPVYTDRKSKFMDIDMQT